MSSAIPLHPRAAQQIFQDILSIEARSTPEVRAIPHSWLNSRPFTPSGDMLEQIVAQSLTQRLERFQVAYFEALRTAKRGVGVTQRVGNNKPRRQMTIRVAEDGATLQCDEVASDKDIEPLLLPLTAIHFIALHPTMPRAFSLGLAPDNEQYDQLRGELTLVDDDDRVFREWILALTCGVNAFQQRQRRQQPANGISPIDLLWQGVRLRIFELADGAEFIDAVATVIRRLNHLIHNCCCCTSDECGDTCPASPALFLRLASLE